jgi:hypothetical protein
MRLGLGRKGVHAERLSDRTLENLYFEDEERSRNVLLI